VLTIVTAGARRLPAALLAAILSLPLAAQDEPKLLAAGAKAPDFVSVTRDGKEVRLADYAGKVVVLDFWATWCGPCIASFPRVQAEAKAHAADGVVVLAVCTSDSRAKFDAWVDANAAKYPDIVFTCDPNDRTSKSFEQRASQSLYRVQGLPTKFVIDKDGKVALAIVGDQENDGRLAAGLARAGVGVDAATAARGEQQAAAEAKQRDDEAKRLAANPPPSFFPTFGSIVRGQDAPDFALAGVDGTAFTLSSLRGKPVVVGLGWGDTAPLALVEEIQATYARYGVQGVVGVVLTERAEFDAWAAKHATDAKARVGWDPAGKMPPLAPGEFDNEARQEWGKTAMIRRYFTGNMLPAMPVLFAVGDDGKLLGSFSARRWQDALGNLLLKAGVALAPEHLPKVVAGPEQFEPPKPRTPEPAVAMLQPGVMAPDFAMTTRDGKTIKLSDFRGKVVVLDFWATWCGPCVAAMPHAQEIADHYKAQDVVVLASCTSDERAKFEAWVDRRTQEFPDVLFAFDPLEKSLERASRKLYGVSGIPQQFVIDKAGKVVAEVGGYQKGEVLLDAALAQAGVQVDAAILEQAKKDQAARDAARKKTAPAMPMRALAPAGGMAPATPSQPAGGERRQ
jgi:peroxiredoxin